MVTAASAEQDEEDDNSGGLGGGCRPYGRWRRAARKPIEAATMLDGVVSGGGVSEGGRRQRWSVLLEKKSLVTEAMVVSPRDDGTW